MLCLEFVEYQSMKFCLLGVWNELTSSILPLVLVLSFSVQVRWWLGMLGNTLEICVSHSCCTVIFFFISTVVIHCPRYQHWLAGRKCAVPILWPEDILSAREVRTLCLNVQWYHLSRFLGCEGVPLWNNDVLPASPSSVCCYECHVFSSTNWKEVLVSQGPSCLSFHKEEDVIWFVFFSLLGQQLYHIPGQ